MTRAEYVSRWQHMIESQSVSGMSVSGWCKANHIQSAYFYSCRKRLRDRQLSCAGFIETKPQMEQSGIRILLGTRPFIEVERGFDPQVLRAVIKALFESGSGRCYP